MSNLHLELLQLAQDKNSDANPSYLLNQGANPNARDPFHHKWTPLHFAVFLNKENFALQLLQHSKTNAQLSDSDGFSPLYWAAKKSTPTVIKALLSKGCDPNERDMHGMTALFAAVASNKPDNVRALLAHPSINVNQPNQFGGSALHHTAFATDSVEMAELLVNAGANLFLYDYENLAPLHVAKRRKRKQLFAYFKQQMKQRAPTLKCDVEFDDEPSAAWDSTTTDTQNSTASEQSMGDAGTGDDEPRTTQLKITSHSAETAVSPADTLHAQRPNAHISLTPPMSATKHTSSLLTAVAAPMHMHSRDRQSHAKSYDDMKHNDEYQQQKQKSEPAPVPHVRVSRNLPGGGALHMQQQHAASAKTPSPQTQDTATTMASAEEMESRWQSEHRRRIARVQESKLTMAQKIETAALDGDARDLLQEQQHYFRYEKEVFYESMKHEYEKLHYQLRHVMNVNKQMFEVNTQLKHENMKLQMALKYSNSGHATSSSGGGDAVLMVSKKRSSGQSAKNKEFKKWFRAEIGDDFIDYYQLFVDSGFDDLRTIRHIHHERELVDLGITKKGHRLHILDKIEHYRMQAQALHRDEVALPAHAPPPVNDSLNELQEIDCEEGSFKTQ
eukprot:CAMPEP_0202733072 /NCGR_PEP_ID=MMETSP1385-20130828/187981_1 /ASSEMBLY_ACC=CAM_ASM_000861 /TAXON_ID=933848 /ORGANISM="Elphidium margaritaceum" /LENGTH=614 /DNA_ID=CAMNT_0049399399 /DNA_START=60 /DNA_END=1904 /DNA_ORIENTATION=+